MVELIRLIICFIYLSKKRKVFKFLLKMFFFQMEYNTNFKVNRIQFFLNFFYIFSLLAAYIQTICQTLVWERCCGIGQKDIKKQ